MLMRKLAILLILASSILTPFAAWSQAPRLSAEVERRKLELEAELKQVEAEIAAQTKLLNTTRGETASIERDLAIIDQEIKRAELTIRKKQIEIERLGGDISKKADTLTALSAKIGEQKESLAELLRKVRDVESESLVEVMLETGQFSDFFRDADSIQQIQLSLHQSFGEIRQTQNLTTEQKTQLEAERQAEIAAKGEIESERALIKRKETEKKELLAVNQTKERAYEYVLSQREKRRQEIRSALFRLQGSPNITFGEALEHATFVSQKTGIRPAFLLAIITQESNLGQNVGTCNRPGDPPAKHWTKIMKPDRDLPPFRAIVAELGISPEGLPLSCPMAGGWGGAMGPAQFIPSTWVIYKDKVAAVTGNRPANPWIPRDAFAASGIYLTQLGAAAGTAAAERTAALKYYAGGNWNKPQNAFYGNDVMRIAAQYQGMVETLQGN